jgi:hypothetical protein
MTAKTATSRAAASDGDLLNYNARSGASCCRGTDDGATGPSKRVT